MDYKEILILQLDEYKRELDRALNGLTSDERRFMPASESHHIDFAFWHASRAEDLLVSVGVLGEEQIWSKERWNDKFGIPAEDVGFGYSIGQVRDMPVVCSADLMSYHMAVRGHTIQSIKASTTDFLNEECPSERLKRFGTKGGVLAHLIIETAEHLGQIAYIRGIIRGANS